jgi:uncharacterized Tic20 family protein
MSDFNQYTAAPDAPSGAPSDEDKTLALITHVSGAILWVLVPLIIWLVNKDRTDKPFLVDQAKEALNFQITMTIPYFIAFVLMIVTLFILSFLPTLVWIANLIFCIMAGVAAQKGTAYRYPFAIRLIK